MTQLNLTILQLVIGTYFTQILHKSIRFSEFDKHSIIFLKRVFIERDVPSTLSLDFKINMPINTFNHDIKIFKQLILNEKRYNVHNQPIYNNQPYCRSDEENPENPSQTQESSTKTPDTIEQKPIQLKIPLNGIYHRPEKYHVNLNDYLKFGQAIHDPNIYLKPTHGFLYIYQVRCPISSDKILLEEQKTRAEGRKDRKVYEPNVLVEAIHFQKNTPDDRKYSRELDLKFWVFHGGKHSTLIDTYYFFGYVVLILIYIPFSVKIYSNYNLSKVRAERGQGKFITFLYSSISNCQLQKCAAIPFDLLHNYLVTIDGVGSIGCNIAGQVLNSISVFSLVTLINFLSIGYGIIYDKNNYSKRQPGMAIIYELFYPINGIILALYAVIIVVGNVFHDEDALHRFDGMIGYTQCVFDILNYVFFYCCQNHTYFRYEESDQNLFKFRNQLLMIGTYYILSFPISFIVSSWFVGGYFQGPVLEWILNLNQIVTIFILNFIASKKDSVYNIIVESYINLPN